VEDWAAHAEREVGRFEDGSSRLPEDADERQRQLTRVANAAYGAGLSRRMQGRDEDARRWLLRAAERYRESFEHAPAGSWGRPIGAIKARVLAGDWPGAAGDAKWALDAGAGGTESPIGRYAAALAHSVLGAWDDARVHADAIRIRDDFPRPVGDALAFVAAHDVIGYIEAVESVLESFETREEYLEDVAVADTVLVLQALAARRDMPAELESALLPSK
jgi:hypothetical protein